MFRYKRERERVKYYIGIRYIDNKRQDIVPACQPLYEDRSHCCADPAGAGSRRRVAIRGAGSRRRVAIRNRNPGSVPGGHDLKKDLEGPFTELSKFQGKISVESCLTFNEFWKFGLKLNELFHFGKKVSIFHNVCPKGRDPFL